jgi:hypothetical protein
LLSNSLRSLTLFLDAHQIGICGEAFESAASKVIEDFEAALVHESEKAGNPDL